MEPVEFAAEAEKGTKLRFKTHKLKARPWNIVETVRLMPEAASPDNGIIFDPNFTFETLEESIRLAHGLVNTTSKRLKIHFHMRSIGGIVIVNSAGRLISR